MGNAESSEQQQPDNNNNDDGNDGDNDESRQRIKGQAADDNNKNTHHHHDDDDDDDDGLNKAKSVKFLAPPPADNDKERSSSTSSPPSSPPPPNRRDNLTATKRSSYFDIQTGSRVTAREGGRVGDLNWRNSNRSIRVLTGDDLQGPAPPWKRILRKCGLLRSGETKTTTTTTTRPSTIVDERDQEQENDKEPHSPLSQYDANEQQANPTNTSRLTHYRIQSRSSSSTSVYDASSLVLDSTRAASVVSEYLRWTFDRSFWHVVVASYLQFLFLVMIFAIFIRLIDLHQPQCITGGTANTKEYLEFGDAFQLSWTTLSTVGYGLIYPSLARVDTDNTRCLGINAVMAIESFVGILFGGVTSAIIFGKIARIQSIASVSFSHPIVIRYGLGVVGTGDHDDDDDEEVEEEENAGETKQKKQTDGNSNPEMQWPCPVLEFRIVNEMSEDSGGEIRNASINVAACFLERLDEPEEYVNLRGSIIDKKKKKKPSTPVRAGKVAGKVAKQTGKALLGGSRDAAKATGSLIQKLHHGLTKPLHLSHPVAAGVGEPDKPFNAAQVEKQVKEQLARELLDAAAHQPSPMIMVDEGNHKLAPRRVYTKLEMSTDSHPFFKRVWSVRHILNEHSPLLSVKARRMVAENGGNWPTELNNHASIRKHVHFEELVVSLSGTSNISGNSVYGQKVYSYEHINVGYAFAPILAMDLSGKVVVDHRLLNDVREQKGGGGEPIEKIKETAKHSARVAQRIDMDASGGLNSTDLGED